MSFEQHEYNFKRLHTFYYDKQLRMYYDRYVREIEEDETISEKDKYNLKQMFKEYLNRRVYSGNERTEDLRAVDTFNLYRRNGKTIDYDFLLDVKLVNIVRSMRLCQEFVETFSVNNVCNMYYRYWLYICKISYNDGSNIESLLVEVKDVFRELINAGFIGESTYSKLCEGFEKDLRDYVSK